MPDLSNLALSASLPCCPNIKSVTDSADSSMVQTLAATNSCDRSSECLIDQMDETCNGNGIKVSKRSRKDGNGKVFEDYVEDKIQKKVESGVSISKCLLPLLNGAPKLADCLVCHNLIYPGEEVLCSVRSCERVYHLKCVKEKLGISVQRKFKCPQHACFVCSTERLLWRCVRCTIASHDKCAPWPDEVTHLNNFPGQAICWRHPTDWRLDRKHDVPTNKIEEIFCRLPLPYVDEVFKIDFSWKEAMENTAEPPPYQHIRRNVYLIKKKRDDADDGIGCTSCGTVCSYNCVCRVQYVSCSKACLCPETCTNRPFRKEKKIRIVKTELCGWGVEAAEPINKREFIIEYIGEVIDDALCEERLWDMKYEGVKNFYMCEIRKDFTIDATFKGNASRFLNHSCEPNCLLEKWQVEGETRVGVFAARSIKTGEALTYDYRFVQFGPQEKCHCGATNCHGYLGTKRKTSKMDLCWGSKRRRSSRKHSAIITV